MYQIEVLYPQRVQGVGNDFDFQFGDTARYRDVDGCGVGERLVRPYRDFMRGVDVLVGQSSDGAGMAEGVSVPTSFL